MRMLGIAVILISILLGCSKRKDLPLQDDYKVIRLYGDAHSIFKPNGRELVMPNVTDVVDDDQYLIGLREVAEPFKLPQGVKDQAYGYFIYEKSSGLLQLGLSYGQLLQLLNEKNIKLKLNNIHTQR